MRMNRNVRHCLGFILSISLVMSGTLPGFQRMQYAYAEENSSVESSFVEEPESLLEELPEEAEPLDREDIEISSAYEDIEDETEPMSEELKSVSENVPTPVESSTDLEKEGTAAEHIGNDSEEQNLEREDKNSVSGSAFAFEEEIATASEIREPENYHTEIIEEPDGELVQFNERFRTYQIGEGQYTTIIGGYSGLFLNEEGEVEAVDNTLNFTDEASSRRETHFLASPSNLRRRTRSLRVSQYKNEAGSTKIYFPERMNRENGIVLTNGEYRLEMIPIFQNYQDSMVSENAIRYSNAYPDTDYQYTVLYGNSIYEDIILLSENAVRSSYSYSIRAGNLKLKKEGSLIAAYDEKKEIFRFELPVMIDAAGEESTDIECSLKREGEDYILSIQPNQGWLKEEERTFPVRIDPGPKEMLPTEMRYANVQSGKPSSYFGNNGNNLIGYSESTGNARIYIALNGDWTSLINSSKENEITNAKFSVYAKDGAGIGQTFAQLLAPSKEWNAQTLNYRTAASLPDYGIFSPDQLAEKDGKMEWDISERMKNFISGKELQAGLFLRAQLEGNSVSNASPLVSIYGPDSMDKGPRIDFSWTGELNGGFSDWKIEDTEASVSPAVSMSELETEVSGELISLSGRSTKGVIVSGKTPEGASVQFELRKEGETLTSLPESTGEAEALYPDYEKAMEGKGDGSELLPASYLSDNYQSEALLPFEDLETDTIYHFYVKAENEEGEKELETDTFLLYQVEAGDLIKRIAKHYGVSSNQILKDNHFGEQLTVKGDILFIRNPKTSEPYSFHVPDNELERFLLASLLKGADPRCEAALEPVNLSTGSFTMERTDLENEDLGGAFRIERSYDSLMPYLRAEFGVGWSSPFSERIMLLRDGSIFFIRGDGKAIPFQQDGEEFHAKEGYDYSLRPVDSISVEIATASELEIPETEEAEEESEALPDVPEESEEDEADREESVENDEDVEESSEESEKSGSSFIAGWELYEPDGSKRTFNAYGILLSREDREEHKTSFIYDNDAKLLEIHTASGKVYKIEQDDRGLVQSITAPDGNRVYYTYNDKDELIRFTDQGGGSISYAYDENHHLLSWTDQLGHKIVENTYDEDGRVLSQKDAEGNVSTLSYRENETELTDNRGNTTVYSQDENGRNIRITYPNGDTEEKTWSEENRLESVTDALGVSERYSYDENGNVLSIERSDGGSRHFTYNTLNLPLTETDYEGNERSYTYDEKGRCTSITSAEGDTTNFHYDSLGRVSSFIAPNGNTTSFHYEGRHPLPSSVTDGEGYTMHLSYDAMERETQRTDALKRTSQKVYDKRGWNIEEVRPDGSKTVYTYDASGNVVRIQDPMEATTTFRYDKLHHILNAEDVLGNTLSFTYDENYNRITETNAENFTTSYRYDERNRMVSVSDAKNNAITYVLDGNGNVIKTIDRRGNTSETVYDATLNLPTLVRDSLGNETKYLYDKNGDLLEIETAEGGVIKNTYNRDRRLRSQEDARGLVTTFSYDKNGNLIEASSGEERIYRFSYDKRDLLIKTENSLQGSRSYQYDGAGQAVKTISENGNKTDYLYDSLGRIEKLTNAMEGTKSFRYDANGNLLSEIDENGHTTSYYRDILGQLTATEDAEGQLTAYRYDRLSNPVLVTDALKGKSESVYDSLSLPVRRTDPAGSAYVYTYDENENLLSVTYPDGDQVHFTYDSENRVKDFTDEAGLRTAYSYDSMGRVIHTEDNAGNRKDIEYNKNGQPTKVTDTIGRVTRYVYDIYGNLVLRLEADGARTEYEYDALDRIIKLIQPDKTEYRYRYDPEGNLIGITEPGEAAYLLEYDALNRLTKLTNPMEAVTEYQYDPVGNLTEKIDAEKNAEHFSYDKIDRLLSHKDGRGNTESYTYDALSRLLSHTTAEGAQTEYRYDALGNKTYQKDPNGLITGYEYDLMGNLLKETSPRGAVTSYTYDKHDELTSVTDAYNGVIRYDVDLNRLVTKRTEKNGAEYLYRYDAVHRLTGFTTPLGYTLDFSYSIGDDILTEKDNLDRSTEYQYDVMHRLIESKDPEGGIRKYSYDQRGNQNSYTDTLGFVWKQNFDLIDQLAESTDPEGKVTSYRYNLVGEFLGITKPGDRSTELRYDENYNVTGLIDPKGYLYQYRYDKDNHLVGTEDPLKQTTERSYDKAGRLLSLKDKLGFRESLLYDGHGNVVEYTEKDGKKTEYLYDLLDRLTSVTKPSGEKASYQYDVMGNLIKSTDLLGRKTNYRYDLENNLLEVKDALGRAEKYDYDIAGRLIASIQNSGETIHYDYDKLNALISKRYENIKSLSRSQLERVKNSENEESLNGTPVLYGYDSEGQRVSMMDMSGESRYSYDGLGRYISVTDGAGEKTGYRYDNADRLSEIIYPDGKSVKYLYDKNDNLTSVTDRSGAVTTYSYDPLNRVTEIHRPNGINSYFTYDAEDHIIEMKNICDECEWVVSDYQYSYDEKGFITGERAVEALYSYAFDDKHQGKHENGRHDSLYPHGTQHRQKHGKDADTGFQIVETDREFTYDADGKLTAIHENEERQGETKYEFRYDAMGNRTYYGKTVRGVLSESTETTYNAANQPISAVEFDGKHYYDIRYHYDEDGNLIEEERGKNGNLKVEKTYTYWVENRLKAVYDRHDILMAAAYDGDGNRIFQLNYNLHTDNDWKGNSGNGNGNNKDNKGQGNSGNGGNNGNGGNKGNKGNNGNHGNSGKSNGKTNGNNGKGGNGKHYGWGFGSFSGIFGGNSNSRSNNGNGNGKSGGAEPNVTDSNGSAYGNTNNTGGSQNRSGILFPESGKVSSIEQELIDLIRTSGKEKNYELIEYVNDVNREHAEVLMELNENGYLDTAYSYGNERLSSDRFEGSKYYYLYEGRGSVSAVTGADGYLTASYRYNAYGEMTFGKPQYENVYGYNGESYNPNLNGQYLRARYYNVGNANFFTEDSYLGDSREPLSLNRYNYAHSNPENYRDPSGQFVLTLSSLAITAGVGAITGVIFSVLDQYTTEGKIEAGRTIKAAFYGATGAVIGVGAGAVVGTALTGIGMGATFSSTVMMGAVDGMITGTAVRANTELLDHAFANFESDRAKLSGTVLDEVPKKTWQESVSRILDPKSTATDAIAGGIAGGLFYMANAAMLKNQVQQCAEGEIAKNARLNSEIGIWEKTNESMSKTAREYQKYITGMDEGLVYKVNGVKFDGYKDGVLIEAKSNYKHFVNKKTGQFYDWFTGKNALISQSMRQVKAANGNRIEWYFNDEVSMKAIKDLLEDYIDDGEIEYILNPMK